MRVTLSPAPNACAGTVSVPASKSAAHRALICAALATGHSRIEGLTLSQDILATQNAMRMLGAHIETAPAAQGKDAASGLYTAEVTGCGGPPFAPPTGEVHCGESGSTLRFLIPLFSLCGTSVRFTGEGRLPQRPQSVYAALFAAQGLPFVQDEAGVTIHGAVQAGAYTVDGSVSSQFISGLLFALPLLAQDSVLTMTPPFESRSYVELTLQAMETFGVRAMWRDAHTLEIPGGQAYCPCARYSVEGDYSQAAFFAVLAAAQGTQPLHGAGQNAQEASEREKAIVLEGLRRDSMQGDKVIFDILQQCGAHVQRTARGEICVCGAPSREKRMLISTNIDLTDCPDLGPVLMVLGLFCAGETVICGAGRLRIKESDRIAAMEQELHRMGGDIRSTDDTVYIKHSVLHGADNLCAHKDHRVVMALCVAALAAGVCVTIDGAQAVEKSYPHFFEDLARLGAEIRSDFEDSGFLHDAQGNHE